MGGWGWNEVLVILGVFTIVEGLSQSILNPNLNRIVIHVQYGTLDFILLKPVDSQIWLSFRHISPWGIPSIVVGSLLVGYGVVKNDPEPTWILYGLLTLFSGFAILYSLWFILGTLSIWFVKIYNVTYVLKTLVESGKFPISAYPTLYRFFMTFVIPVAFLTTVPAEVFLGKARSSILPLSILLAVIFLILARAFWRFALRFYTSASS